MRSSGRRVSALPHFGLFFGEGERELARARRTEAPLAAAWAQLERPPATGTPSLPAPRDALHSLALWGGMRYRFADDAQAAARSLAILRDLLTGEGPSDYLRAAGQLLARAQTLELLRPLLGAEGDALRAAWRAAWQTAPPPREYDEHAWAQLLQLVAGVLLEEEALLEAGAAAFREAIAQDLHPEGYWRPVVGEEMGAAPAGSFARQLRATQAYALLAEAAEHVDARWQKSPGRESSRQSESQSLQSLWTAHSRHVSIRTAIAYCAYYYFFPEHWRWEAEPLRESAPYFRQHGAFLEIALRRAPVRPLPLLLRELRPLAGVYGGGWTTLTHAAPAGRTATPWDWRNVLARIRRAVAKE